MSLSTVRESAQCFLKDSVRGNFCFWDFDMDQENLAPWIRISWSNRSTIWPAHRCFAFATYSVGSKRYILLRSELRRPARCWVCRLYLRIHLSSAPWVIGSLVDGRRWQLTSQLRNRVPGERSLVVFYSWVLISKFITFAAKKLRAVRFGMTLVGKLPHRLTKSQYFGAH